MSIRTKSELKAKFNTGDVPTEQDFNDLLDSLAGLLEDMSGAGKYIFNSPMDFSVEGSSFTAGMYQPVQASGLSLGQESGDFIDTCDALSFINVASTCIADGEGYFSLPKAVAGADFGDGRDGDVVITSAYNINTDLLALNRSIADGKAYNVIELASTSASINGSPEGFSPGDKALLINLQGTNTASINVGNYEEVTVASIEFGVIHFTAPKTKFYGDSGSNDLNLGTVASNQRVIIQRIPQYNSVTITSTGSVTGSAWDGLKGGVVAFKVKETLLNNGLIDASSLGFRSTNNSGIGEGYMGYNVAGGGNSYGGSGYPPGSSYGTTGTIVGGASMVGDTYGDAELTKLFFGAASQCNDNGHPMAIARGGGIIYLVAKNISHNNTILTNGGSVVGELYVGGGAGGSLSLTANTISFGASNITRAIGGSSYVAGQGGAGRVAFKYASLAGSQGGLPLATSIPATGFTTAGDIKSLNIVVGKGATSYSSFKAVVDSIPSSSQATISFSQDEVNWTAPVSLTVGTNNIDVTTLGWNSSNFYYKLDMTGDGTSTPKVDLVELSYAPKRHYTTDQFWVSKPISKPDLSAALPSSFFAMYEFLSGQAAPAFQLISSDNADMSNATVYPAADQYYKEGTANNINSGVRAYLSVQISEPKKYWQIKVKLNAGSVTTSSPVVSRLELEL